MLKIYEIDYHGRSYLLGSAETLREACTLERKAIRKSGGEFPTFTSDGTRQLTHNGKVIREA